jgi:hypothetical protein
MCPRPRCGHGIPNQPLFRWFSISLGGGRPGGWGRESLRRRSRQWHHAVQAGVHSQSVLEQPAINSRRQYSPAEYQLTPSRHNLFVRQILRRRGGVAVTATDDYASPFLCPPFRPIRIITTRVFELRMPLSLVVPSCRIHPNPLARNVLRGRVSTVAMHLLTSRDGEDAKYTLSRVLFRPRLPRSI